MKVIKRICDVIDLVNDWIGRIASFAVLGILAVIVTEVVLRRLFHSPQIWTMDVICMTFGCYIIMVCAYGFQKKAFVAVDVLYARLKPLTQHILHLITYVIFMVPFVFVLVPESWGFSCAPFCRASAAILSGRRRHGRVKLARVCRPDAAGPAGYLRDAQAGNRYR